MRLRQSTLQKKFNIVNKKYHNCILDGEPQNIKSYMVSNRRKMKDITDSFAFKELELNPYSIQQAKSLDRCRLTKIERLDRILSDRFGHLSEKYDVSIDLVERFVVPRRDADEHSFYRKLKKISDRQTDSQ